MKRFWTLLFVAVSARGADRAVITDPAQSQALKRRYVALTDSWIKDIEFTPAERAAMQSGKKWEAEMTAGPDDPLARRILAAGEPSFDALTALYPGKILDRTVLGSYSDPNQPADGYHDEFSIYWNGAIAANLIKGRLTNRLGETGVQPLAHNLTIEFRVGAASELFGRVRDHYSGIRYEDGYLPIVTATYEREGIRYTETALASRPERESAGWDIAYVRFEITNVSQAKRTALLAEHIVLNDGHRPRFSKSRALNADGSVLLAQSDPAASFDDSAGRVEHKFSLEPGATTRVCLEIPYLPDSGHLPGPASCDHFEAVHRKVRAFWSGMLAKAAIIDVPEPRVNDVWRALLLQNFVLADGPKFTYGSGLRYNDSTYPFENGFATHVFAMYGFKDYATRMQPWFVGMSVTPQGAGRKYQNRRAMPLHHLLETWRLTGRTDLFDRFKADYYRVADEIVAERRSTMTGGGEKPLYWGLLPPDKPGVDVQASTQRVYVPGHNITNCQGLEDFGRVLAASGIDAARGKRYLSEAADFRRTLLDAMRRAAIRIPGRPPFVDLQTLLFRQTPDYGPEPYDDLALGRLQGTYFHYWVDMEFHYNFFDPEDDVGQWLADYVQQRNGFVLGLTRARNQTGGPYGWINNVYDGGYYNYRLRRGQVNEFLLGLYAKLAFGMSRNVYVASEGSPFIGYNTENGGYVGADYSFPNSAANADTLLMLRNALVLEELKENIETGRLFLLKGAPRAWLEPGKSIRAERLATYYGDISLKVESPEAGRIIASIEPPKGAWSTLELSLRRPIRKVTVNGAEYAGFDPGGTIRLNRGAARFSVEVSY
ncbi:MAG TPA: hypothetical protein VL285_23525 [Bryobacteraceae bacterium]|jgi:hypothetical protein|nr:hypothetical protein [Bryobacteraceae bacterium]